MGLQACSPPETICRRRVAHINRLTDPSECLLTNGSKITLPPLIAAQIAPRDDVSFPLPNSSTATAEILVTKNSLTGSRRHVYQAPIGYVTQPKKDKRDEFFVAAEVCPANLGISSIFLACKALREYFYRVSDTEGSTGRPTLYEVLQVPCTASPSELRVAFKLRSSLRPSARRAANTFSWSAHSTFSATLGCARATTHCSKILTRLRSSPMVGSARCWFPANGRATRRHFSPGASSRSCQSGTGGVSMRQCANVSSTRTALFTATSAGGSSCGSILLSSTKHGTPTGTDGSICLEPRWRSTRPS